MPLVLSGTNGISTNGTNWALQPDSAGRVTMPYQPVFFASNRTSSANNVDMVFSTAWVNVGSSYSTSTGRFTAPVAGIYEFKWGSLLGSANNTTGRFYLKKNGISPSGDTSATQLRIDLSASGIEIVSGEHSFTIQMAAGDYAYIRFEMDDGSSNTSSPEYSYFGGKLIG